jgi:predicted aspartyl protease
MDRPLVVVLTIALAGMTLQKAHAATVTLPLRYDPTLATQGFQSPVVTASVAGKQVMFLVDTGASVHTLASWFATAAGIRVEASDSTVTGSTGSQSRVRMAANVTLSLDHDQVLVLSQALVTDFPPIFAQQHIAGLLSPQLLAADGEVVVLDLTRPRLTIRRATADGSHLGNVCVNEDSPFRNRLYASDVTIEAKGARLLVDTGANRTLLASQSEAALALADRSTEGEETRGVGNASERVRRVPSVGIERGGSTATLDLRIGTASNNCGADGLLGMDALKTCVLLLGDTGIDLSCHPKNR